VVSCVRPLFLENGGLSVNSTPHSRRVALAAALPFLSIAVSAIFANSTTPPVAKVTGAPGNGSCAECHVGAPTNPGRVLIDFGKLTYTPGLKQRLRVHVLANTATGLTGFQLTARLASNEQLQAGHFEAATVTPAPPPISVQTANGVEYVNHTTATGAKIYTFDWTPPTTNAGNVNFYVVGVAGEANAGPDSNVYNNSYTIAPATRDLPAGFSTQTFIIPGTSSLVEPSGISSNGLVTGRYVDVNARSRGFLRQTSGATLTFAVDTAVDTFPGGVNSTGRTVGSWTDSTGRYHGFIRESNGSIASYDVPGASRTELFDINDAGVIVGRYTDASGTVQGLTIPAGGAPSGRPDFLPTGLNLAGDQAGQINFSAFLLTNLGKLIGTSMCDAGILQSINYSLRINSAREIVGICSNQSQFNSFVVAENGRALRSVNVGDTYRAINDTGTVAGTKASGGITQGAIYTPCSTAPADTAYTISGSGGSGALALRSPSGCVPNASSDVPWFRFGLPDAQNASYSYFVDANPVGVSRSATVWLAGSNVTITQEPASCNVTLSGGPTSFQSQGGTGTLTVTGPEGCTWNAVSNAAWLSITTSTGTIPGTIVFTVAPNTENITIRQGTITVGNTTITVVQTGNISGCLNTVSPLSTSVGAQGGTVFVNVFTGVGCFWSVTNTTPWISVQSVSTTVGSGTVTLFISPQVVGSPSRSSTLSIAGQLVTIFQTGDGTGSSSGLRFVPIAPCRVADTRDGSGKTGSFGPPRLTTNSTRNFPIPQGSCGIPSNARAYATNITVVPPGPLSFLTAYPSGTDRPNASTLNSFNGRVVANAAIVPAGFDGSINVYVSNDTDVIIDVNGYFLPAELFQGLVFYPVTPCRISDSRPEGGKTGSFGPPAIPGQTARTILVPQSSCNIPSYAQAYSMNVTAVPQGPLGFLTLYPTGQLRPNASTLNAFNGQVVANAAIVQAGTSGAIDVFASDTTNVVIDINGYFAAPGFGNALNFYTVIPCRVADTRSDSGKTGVFGPPIINAGGTRDFPVSQAGCNVPFSAQAYSLNMTVVPPGPLAYLTTWPSGFTQPLVSTLNAFDGQVVANAALVPAGSNGSVSVFVSNTSNVIVDVNGYFAP